MTTIQLTQKERLLLEDQKKHEEMCIIKYDNYANEAQDPQLKQLFLSLKQQEQNHYDTINQILGGQVPNMQNQQQGQQQNQQGMQNQQKGQQQTQNSGSNLTNVSDDILCNDLLMTEKYVSSTYDTTIFEFTDTNVREVLNHIQKEEQQHGEQIFNYMQANGMYQPQ
ncbi:spore coat protein [Serpentinicella sp. ANB-PHB4]|uniref:spore coat protein n=1 Tax=Serpentinicella sp. ANB-PHB4 TaxID=3074076 RepID=UPI00285C55EC|nr:spore coat protein [Serpentinicella sp. ANB-PHB4]MDR5659689.1 spore coat protein [Serpentinicella sp. ANB-PHB4]